MIKKLKKFLLNKIIHRPIHCIMILPDDIFYLICLNISNLQELIKLELLSSRYKKLIRQIKWNTFVVQIKSEYQLLKMMSHHVF